MILKAYIAFIVLLTCFGCSNSTPSEKQAISCVEQHVSVSSPLSARKLGGGFSESIVFLVTNKESRYVVKFFKNKQHAACEIYNSRVASEGGFGPKFYFADEAKGVMISEYLSGEKLSQKDFESNRVRLALAQLLQKIHRGKEFNSQCQYNVFRRIARDIKEGQSKCGDAVPLSAVACLVDTIREALSLHVNNTPCHNDLHRGNIVFVGDKCQAIDYGDASRGDSCFDVATVANAFFMDSAQGDLLLTTYLERAPTEVEKAKLYLMRQLVFIKWACDRLRELSEKDLERYQVIPTPSLRDFMQQELEGRIDLRRPEDAIKLMKLLLMGVFDECDSQKFEQAVSCLGL